MSQYKQVILFVIINILVSAGTTYTVLRLWELNRETTSPSTSADPGMVSTILVAEEPKAMAITATLPQLPPVDIAVIEIKNVIGVGDLMNERVQLNRLGEGDLWLTGWKLLDEDGNVFTFPNLKVNKDGAIQVLSRAGTDTVIELYWGLDKAAWRTGEMVTLLDSKGQLRASYRIP